MIYCCLHCSLFASDVQQLCGSCPRLSELDLSDSQITSKSIDHIVLHLPWLRYLALSRCYNIALTGLVLVLLYAFSFLVYDGSYSVANAIAWAAYSD